MVSLTVAVVESRRAGLVALRDRLANTIETSSDARSLSQLAKQLTDVLRELDSLAEVKESTPLDDLTARRSARRSKSQAV